MRKFWNFAIPVVIWNSNNVFKAIFSSSSSQARCYSILLATGRILLPSVLSFVFAELISLTSHWCSLFTHAFLQQAYFPFRLSYYSSSFLTSSYNGKIILLLDSSRRSFFLGLSNSLQTLIKLNVFFFQIFTFNIDDRYNVVQQLDLEYYVLYNWETSYCTSESRKSHLPFYRIAIYWYFSYST